MSYEAFIGDRPSINSSLEWAVVAMAEMERWGCSLWSQHGSLAFFVSHSQARTQRYSELVHCRLTLFLALWHLIRVPVPIEKKGSSPGTFTSYRRVKIHLPRDTALLWVKCGWKLSEAKIWEEMLYQIYTQEIVKEQLFLILLYF